ncbi:hypothetical protein JVU11DRAFT_10383 [Chiua virens]|nr:hypothetical protein JVU11DRAFT_10383 [Chiua virens]
MHLEPDLFEVSLPIAPAMSTDNAANKLATPRRSITPMQVLSGLFRTPTRLHTPTTTLEFVSRHRNKRTRSSTLSSPSSQPTPSSTPCTKPSLPAVVLQTYSVSTDSIVLTSLPSVPFCCHEDLLTMSRTQLEGVVRALNARLASADVDQSGHGRQFLEKRHTERAS